jgi:hypothetical protein
MTPQQIDKILNDNTKKLVELGTKISDKRNLVILAQASLFDAESEARKFIFSPECNIQASKIRDYIKLCSANAEKEYEKLNQELRQLVLERETLIEVTNNVKARLRIIEMELRNLNTPLTN